MKKELYFKPALKVLTVNEEPLAVPSLSDEEISDEFEEGAKQGFSLDSDPLPTSKNIWDEEF